MHHEAAPDRAGSAPSVRGAQARTPERGASTASVGIVGARGYAGAELIGLVTEHPGLELLFASSRRLAGEPIAGRPGGGTEMSYVDLSPTEVARSGADVIVLALPDGASREFVRAIEEARADGVVIVDLSSDHRFEDAWAYGLTEINASRIAGSRRIANPGCYATAMQLAIRPVLALLEGTPHCFGVSGYSGAGTAPSERNDPAALDGGVLAYALAGHKHEGEATRHLRRAVRFVPHVAPFFRGLSVTCVFELREPVSAGTLAARYERAYASSTLIRVEPERSPRIAEVAGTNGAVIGAITVDGERGRQCACVCALDNLRKGAASQAIQNIDLALGRGATEGLAW